jgi:hypothetical protein
MSNSIRGNEIVFRNTNSANPSDIKLKHENANNQLVFNSEVIFNQDISTSTITLGQYQIALSNQDLAVNKKLNLLPILKPLHSIQFVLLIYFLGFFKMALSLFLLVA